MASSSASFGRLDRAGVFIAISLLLVGCAGTHLYRKADHDLALKAQTGFADAKLAEITADERKRLDEMLRAELTASRRQILATRDADLLAVLGETTNAWPQLETAALTRLETLVGVGQVPALVGAYNTAEAAREQLTRSANAY